MKCIAIKTFAVNHKAKMTIYEVAIGPVLREQGATVVIKNKLDGKECWVCKSDLVDPFGKLSKNVNKKIGITVYTSALEYDDTFLPLFREWNEITHDHFWKLFEETKDHIRKGYTTNILHPFAADLEKLATA